MTTNMILGSIAVALGLGSNLLYLFQVLRHKIKPHLFSWIIWGTIGSIGFAAQYAGNAGPGCWTVGASAAFCFVIVGAAFFYGDKKITRGDWIALLIALSAIPVWVVTNNPLWAAVIATFIDLAAFYPTYRKSWLRPREEGGIAFFFYGLQMLFAVLAVDTFSVTTALYPFAIFVLNMGLVAVIYFRGKVLERVSA